MPHSLGCGLHASVVLLWRHFELYGCVDGVMVLWTNPCGLVEAEVCDEVQAAGLLENLKVLSMANRSHVPLAPTNASVSVQG